MPKLNYLVLLLLFLPFLHVATFGVGPGSIVLLIVAILVMLVPIFREADTWTLVVSSLLIVAAIMSRRVEETPTPAHMALLEVASFSLIVVIAQKAGRAIELFSAALEELNVALSGGGAIPFDDWSNHVDEAMVNGRRFDQPVSVIDVRPTLPEGGTALNELIGHLNEGLKRRLLLQNVGGILAESLRRTDVVLGDADTGSLVVVCRSTGPDQANHVVQSIDRVSRESGLSVDCSTASFPSQGLTFPELLAQARSDRSRNPKVEQRLESVAQLSP